MIVTPDERALENEMLAVTKQYANRPLTPRMRLECCLAVKQFLRSKVDSGLLPPLIDTRVGMIATDRRSRQIVIWLSDAMQLWLWGCVKVQLTHGYVVLQERI